ncbi:MAG: sigma-70 family RNA polymerase sigma factor [Candidatus Omnitrophica bacterium]|nr:sigma-70 family RNA polymerase sigma factor [Candidatus Omnitrophota bacterium]
MNKDDAELIARLLSGDKRAWDEFVNLYSKDIYNSIKQTLNKHRVSVSSAADDLFQEMFLSLCETNFEKLKSFKGLYEGRLKGFLETMARNRTIDYLRRIKTKSLEIEEKKRPSGPKEREERKRLNQALSVWPNIFLSEGKEIQMEEILDCLDEEDRKFVQLAFLSKPKLRSKEGARILGMSVAAYNMRRKRMKEKLREILKRNFHEDR